MAGKIALALVDESNEFQQLLKQDAEAAAHRAGLSLEVHFTGEDLNEHLHELRHLIEDEASRPDALLVMAVRDHGLSRTVRQAARAGVHWIFLNRTEDDLEPIRAEFPAAVVTTVCPNEIETGRVQGRQFKALLAQGKVLYIQGNPRSLASRERTTGMQEEVAGAPFEVVLAGGDWNPQAAGRAVQDWLRFAVGGRLPFDLIGCQNDHMAGGVLEALAAAAADLRRPELLRIPVTGCDGSPEFGQRMVREGRLAATVVLPRVAGPAVERIGRYLHHGERPPETVQHGATSFPAHTELHTISNPGSAAR
jgi:ABC-type sugar transport system substrate-binding protein